MIPNALPPIPSKIVQTTRVDHSVKCSPYLPYTEGKPIYDPTNPTVIEFHIDFSQLPFTFLNMGAYNDDPTPQITVYIKNLPVGTVFFIATPNEWGVPTPLGVSKLILEDTNNIYGNNLPNKELEVGDIVSGVKGLFVTRDNTGLKSMLLS